MSASAAGRHRAKVDGKGSPKETVGIFFDVKLAGEALTAPHLRTPPLKEGRLPKLLNAVLKARVNDYSSSQPALDPADCFFLFDGCKRGSSLSLVLFGGQLGARLDAKSQH